jgi:ribosomal-protein-serine acetyltransferase
MFSYRIDDDTELKLLELHHAEELFNLINANREDLREWLPWVDGTQKEEDVKAFITSTRKQFCSNEGFTSGIFYKGSLGGVIGYNSANWKNRHIAIGYWLGKEFQGKGIMTRACRAFVNHAFVEYKLNRVEIRAAVQNVKSRAIPERLGFTHEGIIRQAGWLYDHFVDHAVYGMLAEEWKGR